MKKCRTCGQEKELKDFPKAKMCVDGRFHSCKTCTNKKEANRRKVRKGISDDFFNMFL